MRLFLRLKVMRWRLFAGALVVALASYVSVQYLKSVDSPPLSPRALSQVILDSPGKNIKKEESGMSSGRSGMEVYLDPKTGQFEKPPAGNILGRAQASQPPRGAEGEPKISRKGFEEKESPVIGGGIVTDVHLRFRRPLVASRDASGKLSIQHMPQDADLNGEQ
jgi:hypothetical protein